MIAQKMNGDWKKVMFQLYGLGAVFIIALGIVWQTVLLPNLNEQRANAQTLREQIPKQTDVLLEMRDQGKISLNVQQTLVDELTLRQKEHAEQSTEHREITNLLKELCETMHADDP